MANPDTTKVNNFKSAIENKLEQLKNKKNDITGDFTQDNTSYPTVSAVKTFVASLFDGLHEVATTGEYSDLENTPVFDIVKQATAESGFASTYYMTVDGIQVGAKINIEKDKMLRSVTIETVSATPSAEETAAGLSEGDQYILMVVETADSEGTSNLILPIADVFDLQTADETTLTLSENGVYSIKAAGVTSTELAADSVITAKIADSNVTTAKIADKNVTLAKLADEVQTQWTADADTECEAYLDALTAAINEL